MPRWKFWTLVTFESLLFTGAGYLIADLDLSYFWFLVPAALHFILLDHYNGGKPTPAHPRGHHERRYDPTDIH